MFTHLSSPSQGVVSVSELNRSVRQLLEGSLPVLWVAGEISNFKRYDSGHCYFSLKDSAAQVRCVMFRNRAALLDFRPLDGLQVEIRAVVSLYEARGDYQLTVEAMRPAGSGALFAAFEALKKKLDAEGLFAASRKRALPAFPARIGIVSSPSGAALRDMLSTLRRRWPGIAIILYPSAVQGAQAPAELLAALKTASARNEVDVLIVGRGGGSLEDLWAFNDEALARAIAAAPMPVISAVGHETDFTIADFVADVRAPTPTAAAELASPDRAHWQQRLNMLDAQLARAMARTLGNRAQQLDQLGRRLRHPGETLRLQGMALQAIANKARNAIHQQVSRSRLQLAQLERRLQRQQPDLAPLTHRLERLQQSLHTAAHRQLGEQQQRLAYARIRLDTLNPRAVLARGYGYVTLDNGRLAASVAQLPPRTHATLHLADGEVGISVDAPSPSQGDLF
ncbi:exodeoxyribonuclease VII large subunit [Chitinilyticum litopenaei]|uniref:exodeoxyribonuclease VII large subunit n=1 Tax=Chitinilyticum litopenaei TaxID=1121276 RepID=UPI0003F83EA2|nr:exodeoxyribonuclease VII large subunit [Chitinilyticum litopenaei]